MHEIDFNQSFRSCTASVSASAVFKSVLGFKFLNDSGSSLSTRRRHPEGLHLTLCTSNTILSTSHWVLSSRDIIQTICCIEVYSGDLYSTRQVCSVVVFDDPLFESKMYSVFSWAMCQKQCLK